MKASHSLVEHAGPGSRRGQRSVSIRKKVWRLLCERSVEIGLVASKDHPGREWKQHSFVRIPGKSARIAQTLERAWRASGQQRTRAVRAVDVKPDITLAADLPDRLEIVE